MKKPVTIADMAKYADPRLARKVQESILRTPNNIRRLLLGRK